MSHADIEANDNRSCEVERHWRAKLRSLQGGRD